MGNVKLRSALRANFEKDYLKFALDCMRRRKHLPGRLLSEHILCASSLHATVQGEGTSIIWLDQSANF